MQNKPSSQRLAFALFTTTSPTSSQLSSVHTTPSSTETDVPASQPRATSQLSDPLQNKPSSQRLAFALFTTSSPTSSQLSSVHATPSSTETGVPASQPRATSQLSDPLQNKPSSQLTGVD